MNTTLIAATLTPFNHLGKLDLDLLRQHIVWLRECGIQGFAPTGTTGEFLYLSWEERRAVHQAVIEAARGVRVIPCVWDPQPQQAIALAQHAADNGADAVFLPPPLFHVVEESVILRWYEALVKEVSIPVWAYHHPRTHNPISASLFAQLLELGVQGLKDSSGVPARVHSLCQAHPGQVWVGGESMLPRLEVMSGAAGHISRLANLYPRLALRVLKEGIGSAANRYLSLDKQLAKRGGLPAVKTALGMGCRLPIVTQPDMDLSDVPSPGFPNEASENP